MKKCTIKTSIGAIGLWDRISVLPKGQNLKFRQIEALLKKSTAEGKVFYAYSNYELEHDERLFPVHLYIDEDLPGHIEDVYEAKGGNFLLKSESGDIQFGGLENFLGSESQHSGKYETLTLAKGEYVVRFYELNPDAFGFKKIDEEKRKHIGDMKYNFHKMIERLCLIGYLPLLLGIMLLFFKKWIIALTLICCSIFFIVVIQKTKKFNKIEQELSEFQKDTFPTFVIRIMEADRVDNLVGGSIQIE